MEDRHQYEQTVQWVKRGPLLTDLHTITHNVKVDKWIQRVNYIVSTVTISA